MRGSAQADSRPYPIWPSLTATVTATSAANARLTQPQAAKHSCLTGLSWVSAPCIDAEDLVADLELGYGRARCFDLTSHLRAEDLPPRLWETADEAAEERLALANPSVCPVDRRGANPDEDLILFGCRRLDVFKPQHLWWPVPLEDDCSHSLPVRLRLGRKAPDHASPQDVRPASSSGQSHSSSTPASISVYRTSLSRQRDSVTSHPP